MRWLYPAFLFVLVACSAREYYLVTGTYTNTGSAGIYVHQFSAASGASVLVDSMVSSNPSFLAVSQNGNYVYAVNEDGKGKGAVSAFSFNKQTGKISFLNQQISSGDHPCHLALDASGRWLTVANYSSGTVAAYAIRQNGSIDSPYIVIQLTGKGKDAKRQQSAHAHQVVFSPNNKFLYVTDLGSDKIMIYSFDAATGTITPANPAFVAAAPGSGPRHLAFHPKLPYCYLLTELDSRIITFAYNASSGALETASHTSALPKGFSGFGGSAEIALSPDAKYGYASNRGASNSIALFSINPVTGWALVSQIDSSLGKAPRHFTIHPSGKYLLVANMDSDEVVVFKINRNSGRLTNSGKRISIRKPVCLQWVRAQQG